MTGELFEKLSAPFPAADIEWRAGATNADKTKALAVAYITSRAVMNRLDDVMTPANWRDEYTKGPDGGVMCGLSLRIKDEWITKWDGADNTDIESVKGGISDALKRAAVKWGIGRYLYNLDGVWVKCEPRGKTIVLAETPKLPAWAMPGTTKPPQTSHSSTPEPAQNVIQEEGNGAKPADYSGPRAKIGKNSYPSAWASRLMPEFVISGKCNQFELDGILGKLNLTAASEPDAVAAKVGEYLAKKEAA